MAYRRNDSGCGCLLAIIIVMAIISGVRGCTEKMIKGDLKLPNFGSSRVSGGSGGYGTSNGYNVKYKQTTSPNYNSSSNDYTHTNSQPTEYKEGKTEKSTNSIPPTSSKSTIGEISNTTSQQYSQTYYRTCSFCNGKGKSLSFEIFNDLFGGTCEKCGRSDMHSHDVIEECKICSGTGRVKVTRVQTQVGEFEMQVYE